MRRFTGILLLLLSLLILTPCQAAKTKPVTAKIEVYYFHYTRRCLTCNAVETETLKSLEALYPKFIKSGKITFKSLNLDESSSKELANKLAIEGQCLLIVKGKTKTDLTSHGFMYARSNPSKFRAGLKAVVDPLIQK